MRGRLERELSPAQIRNRLILAARRIVADHAPDDGGRCPVCRVANCAAALMAVAYLEQHDETVLAGGQTTPTDGPAAARPTNP